MICNKLQKPTVLGKNLEKGSKQTKRRQNNRQSFLFNISYTNSVIKAEALIYLKRKQKIPLEKAANNV